MSNDELSLYLVETEKRYAEMAEKYRSAVQLIGRLLDPTMEEDAKSYSDVLKPWLESQNIEYNSHAGWCVSGLAETPDPEVLSGWHREMIVAAREYYRKLNAGEDPGSAKEYLDNLSTPTMSPELAAQKWDRFEQMVSMMDLSRLMKHGE